MSAALNDRFATWAQAPSKTESDKIEHSITAIKKALAADPAVASASKVFVQGSYRNRVNVRQESDVDIGVLYTGGAFYGHYPVGKGYADFGNIAASYTYAQFKNDIGKALTTYFGTGHVTRGDKAFDVHENSYRVDADVVPLFVHRRYWENGGYFCGTELHPDSGGRIINWPERLYDTADWPDQHYEKGNKKNHETGRAYRGVVRIIKKLRCIMDEEGIPEAKPIKGFNIECLVWNAPNSCFTNSTWFEDVSAVLNHLSTYLSSMLLCGDWTEVSGWKSLLDSDDAKRKQLEAFVDRARKYTGIA
jgi:hypothetical protein